MRVVILVTLFPPKWLAGTEIATYNIAKYLTKRGHEVHVITWQDNGLPKESLEEGFHVHRIRAPRLKFVGRSLYVLKELLLIKHLNPVIVHAQGITRGLACTLAKRMFKIPYIVWGRGSDVYLPWSFKGLISKFVLRDADALIALTEHMKKKMCELIGYDRSDIFVIPNGVDLNLFNSCVKRFTQPPLKVERYEKAIVYVGRLEPIKGVKYLIEAIKILRERGVRDLKLLIVGEGTEKKSLKELVRKWDLENCVVFMGQVPHHKIPSLLASTAIFVLPSLSEGFSNGILEAMAVGLPVIATKVAGLPEIVRNGESGFLVEPCNSLEIAEKCALLLTNDNLRTNISKNNREVVKNYSWEKVVEKLEKVYLYVLYKNKSMSLKAVGCWSPLH